MNQEDFESRVLPTKNKLYRFAFKLLGSSEEAKDVVQETMIKVWNGREDNEVLSDLIIELDSAKPGFRDAVYQALTERYKEVTGTP